VIAMRAVWIVGATALLAACGGDVPDTAPAPAVTGTAVAVVDTVITATTEATGMAAPMESATLSTKLMASVVDVTVLEGATVRRGETLVRLDLRDLTAKRAQAEAGLADAEAQRDLARVNATRFRALFADSAAPKAQLEAAEAGLARAEAGVRAMTAGLAELAAVAAYGDVRAPFDGVVSRRFVDPGAFVVPGAPMITVDKLGALRVTVTVPSAQVAGLRAGQRVASTIEGDTVTAMIEGVARSAGGTYTVNAVVANAGGRFLGGSAATLRLPAGERRALLVPTVALHREGDLVSVHRRTAQGDLMTVLRVGNVVGDRTEVLGGLTATDSVVVPAMAGRP
jgi:RND family efflux transporter MFP subunit